MRALRLGSYSIVVTRPDTPNLFRLKSMMRYFRLWPPPRWRTVVRPVLLRPPLFFNGANSDRSGVVVVRSLKLDTLMPLRPGDVGLYLLIAMVLIDSLPIR